MSASGGILKLRGSDHLVAKVRRQVLRRPEVSAAADDRGQLTLQRCETQQANPVVWLELHEEVDVTGRGEVRAQRRAVGVLLSRP